MSQPSDLQNASNTLLWTNGRGLITGASLSGLFALIIAILSGMGTWTNGVYSANVTAGSLTPFFQGLTTNSNPPQGALTFPTNVPGMVLGDLTRPFTILGTATGGPSQDNSAGLLFLQKTLSYTSTTAGNSGAETVNLQYNNGPNVQAWALAGNVYVTATANATAQAEAIGSTGSAQCYTPGCIAMWGSLFATYEQSGSVIAAGALSGTPNPTHQEIALELDNYAGGTDQYQLRVGLQISCNNAGFLSAPALGPTQCGHGVLLSTGNATGTPNTSSWSSGGMILHGIDGRNASFQTAIDFSSANITAYAVATPGFRLDNVGNIPAVGNITSSGSLYLGVGTGVEWLNNGSLTAQVAYNTNSGMDFDSPNGWVFRVAGSSPLQNAALLTATGNFSIAGGASFGVGTTGGVACHGVPDANFTVTGGIVTQC